MVRSRSCQVIYYFDTPALEDINLLVLPSVARQKNPRGIGWRFYRCLCLIGSLESPPSNLLRATRKPDVLVLSEIHGKGTGCG